MAFDWELKKVLDPKKINKRKMELKDVRTKDV